MSSPRAPPSPHSAFSTNQSYRSDQLTLSRSQQRRGASVFVPSFPIPLIIPILRIAPSSALRVPPSAHALRVLISIWEAAIGKHLDVERSMCFVENISSP